VRIETNRGCKMYHPRINETTGTRAGAVDVDFSNKTCLELWDLGLDREDASEEITPRLLSSDVVQAKSLKLVTSIS
jgi:hypothetical protein